MFSTLVARGQKRCGLLYCSKLIWFKEETTRLCSAEMLRWSGAGDGGGRVRTSRPAAQLHLARDWSGEHQLKQLNATGALTWRQRTPAEAVPAAPLRPHHEAGTRRQHARQGPDLNRALPHPRHGRSSSRIYCDKYLLTFHIF